MIKLKIWGNIGPKTSYAVEQAIAEKRDDNETEVYQILLQ